MNESEETVDEARNVTESDTDENVNSSVLNIEEKLSLMPDVLEYVQGLLKLISRHEKKIKKLQRRLKARQECVDVGVQTGGDDSKGLTEEITEAAQNAIAKSGFVYEETSGLYYDYNSGYYYNAEYGLYYDGNTGTYMSYDNERQEYVFHSRVEPQENGDIANSNKRCKNQRKKQDQKKTRQLQQHRQADSNLEEGECSDWGADKETSSGSDSDTDIDISKHYPPCMRIIVEDTQIASIKPGSLYIVTYDGGTLGREGDHDVLLPDINVSKHHLRFAFDKDRNLYLVTDLGSRNGTILNGKRMSASKCESEAEEVVHGARIQIGSTTLLCHVHVGNQTCGLCEPGLIQKGTDDDDAKSMASVSDNKQSLHRRELRNLKRKFAVGGKVVGLGEGYTDRAQVRRDTVGSQNENEKTQVACLDRSISSENKGFKLLSKMGWSAGQSLGKDGTGRTEPVELVSNPGTAGIGMDIETSAPPIVKPTKSDIWNKARERYQQLDKEA